MKYYNKVFILNAENNTDNFYDYCDYREKNRFKSQNTEVAFYNIDCLIDNFPYRVKRIGITSEHLYIYFTPLKLDTYIAKIRLAVFLEESYNCMQLGAAVIGKFMRDM